MELTQEMNDMNRLIEIKKNNDDIEQQIKQHKTNITVTMKYNQYKNELVILEKEIDSLNDNIEKTKNELSSKKIIVEQNKNIQKAIVIAETKKNEYNMLLKQKNINDTAKQNNNYREYEKLNNEISEHENAIKNTMTNLNINCNHNFNIDEEINKLTMQEKELMNTIKESLKTNYENNHKYETNEQNKQQKNKKEIELKLLTIMCDRLGGDKGIVNNTLDKYILPHLQERVNNILTELGEYEIVIKRNGDMGLDIFKHTTDGLLEMDTMSGCENILANIAFRSAMNELNTNMKCDILIIDEGFQYCDDKTIEKISLYFDYVRNNYKCAIVISHDERIKKMYDSVYTIIQNKDKDSALIIQ